MKLATYFSTSWNLESASRWEKTRSKGKVNFVLIRGLLFFGGLMFVTAAVSQFLWGHFTWQSVSPYLFSCPIVGIVWGMLMWNHLEAGYRSYQSRCELEHLEVSQPKLASKS